MTKETPEPIITDIAIKPLGRIMEEGFHPKDGGPISTTPIVYGKGSHAKTEFPGNCHPSGDMAKTMELFATMQGAFAQAHNIHFEPRLWHGQRHSGEFSDFSIIVDGEHATLPTGIATILQEEGAGRPSRHNSR